MHQDPAIRNHQWLLRFGRGRGRLPRHIFAVQKVAQGERGKGRWNILETEACGCGGTCFCRVSFVVFLGVVVLLVVAAVILIRSSMGSTVMLGLFSLVSFGRFGRWKSRHYCLYLAFVSFG